MNTYKKILSGVMLSSLILSNISISHASTEVKPTAEEVKKVETQIVSLQSNLFDNSKTVFEKLSSDFQKLANYEEKGNSSLDISIDEDAFGKGKASFQLKDYNIKNATFDSEISSDVMVSADYTPVYGSGFELDLTTFASLITKDSEIYALLKDFNFTVTDENISEILTQVKDQFKDNTYVKLPSDDQSKMAFTLLQSFDPKSFLNQLDTKLQTPFFTPYKKEGTKYLLVPTKFACDTYFEVDQKLNFSNAWYTPQTCSEGVYKKVVSEFIQNGELYITLGNNENTLGYYFVDKSDKTAVDVQITYNETNISKVDISVIPDQSKYKNEGFSLNYARNEFLKANLYAEKGTYKMDFYSELDKNNNFIEIQGSLNLNKDVIGTLTLKGKKLNSFVLMKQKGYDYSSKDWEYKLKNVFAVKVTGTLDTTNNISTLVTKFAGVDIKTKQAFLLGKVGYNAGDFTTYMKYEDAMGKLVLNGKGQVEDKYFSYDSTFDVNGMYKGDLLFQVDTRNDKNNGIIDLHVNNGTKDVLKMNFKNEAKREYKTEIKIEAPKDFKEFRASALNEEIYGDYLKQARDTKRISDLNNIQMGLELYHAVNNKYPNKLSELVPKHLSYLPKDEMEGQYDGTCRFGYSYSLTTNPNINTTYYALYTCVETDEYKQKAKTDGGDIENMYEIFSK